MSDVIEKMDWVDWSSLFLVSLMFMIPFIIKKLNLEWRLVFILRLINNYLLSKSISLKDTNFVPCFERRALSTISYLFGSLDAKRIIAYRSLLIGSAISITIFAFYYLYVYDNTFGDAVDYKRETIQHLDKAKSILPDLDGCIDGVATCPADFERYNAFCSVDRYSFLGCKHFYSYKEILADEACDIRRQVLLLDAEYNSDFKGKYLSLSYGEFNLYCVLFVLFFSVSVFHFSSVVLTQYLIALGRDYSVKSNAHKLFVLSFLLCLDAAVCLFMFVGSIYLSRYIYLPLSEYLWANDLDVYFDVRACKLAYFPASFVSYYDTQIGYYLGKDYAYTNQFGLDDYGVSFKSVVCRSLMHVYNITINFIEGNFLNNKNQDTFLWFSFVIPIVPLFIHFAIIAWSFILSLYASIVGQQVHSALEKADKGDLGAIYKAWFLYFCSSALVCIAVLGRILYK